ncbi:MAG: hypothetical protein GX130_04910 [Candidatus Hydrogenedens sp.]|jgi:hypothetical protein|nr:hypothetical protein [Candidatus Hydrogenedens sp.]
MKEDSRHIAISMTKSISKIVESATGESLDFYMLLWTVHWAIDYYGVEKTRNKLVEILLDTDFKAQGLATQLRDTLFQEQMDQDALGDWFVKAMKG